jgi:hypothetical protein
MVRTIFDIYKDVLRELDGTSIPKVTVTSESDYLVLQPGTNDDIYQFYVDPAICGNVNMSFQMTNFATVAGETPSGIGDGVYDPSDYVSADSSISLPYKMTTTNFYNSTQEKEIPASSTEDVCSVNISNIPFNYDHADILIQYSVKTDGEFDVTWDGEWILSSQGSFPVNITPSDLMQSDNSDVDLDYINANTTLVQRFYIKSIPNMRSGDVLPDSTITMSVKNNLGTSITLSNIIVKPSFFHYADYPADGTVGGSTSFATDNTDPEGDTCYYVKSNGQIIVKLTESLLNVTSPSAMWRDLGTQSYIQGWYYVSTSPEVIDWVLLQQNPDNPLIFTQPSSDDYLTTEQVAIWKSTGGLYYGPINAISLYDALKKMTRIGYLSENDGIISLEATFIDPSSENWELYPPPYNYQAYDPYWQSVEPAPASWWEVWKTFMPVTTYTGYTGIRLRINGEYGLIGTYAAQDNVKQSRTYHFDTNEIIQWAIKNKILNMTIPELLNSVFFENFTGCWNRYVTKKITSSNCGRKDTTEEDPDEPNVFPTAPVGPSYMQYMLNNNNDWTEISSGTKLLYVEKTDTGTDPEDYDGTIDQFYIGYKNLNSISYYAPATIAVNCIISYEQFKDTYVYGDYY